MRREVEFNRIASSLQGLEYSIERKSAAGQLADVTLLLADDEANLRGLIVATANNEFELPDDVISGLHNTLPRAAVGEPSQSDRDS